MLQFKYMLESHKWLSAQQGATVHKFKKLFLAI